MIQEASRQDQLKRLQKEKAEAAAKAAPVFVNVTIHIDKELGLTTEKQVRVGSKASELKALLAEDDPSGQMHASDIDLAMHMPGSSRRRRLHDDEVIADGIGELEICAPGDELEDDVNDTAREMEDQKASLPMAVDNSTMASQGFAPKPRSGRVSAFSSRFPLASKHALHSGAQTEAPEEIEHEQEDTQLDEKRPAYDVAGLLSGVTGSRSQPPTILEISSKASTASTDKVWGDITWTGPTICFEIGDEILPMRLDADAPMMPADVTQIWERHWGIRYASRLKFSAKSESGMRILKPRGDVLPTHPDVVRLDAGAGGLSVLSVLVSALKNYSGMTLEEVLAEREQKQRALEVKRDPGMPTAANSTRQRSVLNPPRPNPRLAGAAGNLEGRLGQLRGAPHSGSDAPRGPARQMPRGNPLPFAGRIMPGASSSPG